jgi:hypothetical protein
VELMAKCVQLLKNILGVDHPHTNLALSILNEWERERLLLKG